MIATGTDVKPLECLLFMRNVNSAGYFEQMKGRGVRVIDRDDLQSVTPDAQDKTHFVIVDAVGVCERDKTVSPPLDRKPSVSMRKLLQMVAMGMVHPDLVSSLASRLARLGRQVDEAQAARIAKEADGASLGALTGALLDSIDPEATHEAAVERFDLADDEDPTQAATGRSGARAHEPGAQALYAKPGLRKAIIDVTSKPVPDHRRGGHRRTCSTSGTARRRSRARGPSWTTSNGSSMRTRTRSRRSASCTADPTGRGSGTAT